MLKPLEETLMTRVDHESASLEMRRLFECDIALSLTEVWLETKHGQRIRIGIWRDTIQALEKFEKLMVALDRRGRAEVMEWVRLETNKKSAFKKNTTAKIKLA